MDGIICSDYHKGILTEKIIKAIMHRAQKSKKPVIVDPKSSDFSLYKGASVITPNEREVASSVPIKIKDNEDLGRAAEYLLNLTRAQAILITRGKDGMALYQNKEKLISIPTVAKEVFDVTGAGDTVISVFSMAVFVGFNYHEAAWLSNMAASVVVGKVGTAVITLEEINEFLHEEMLRTSHTVLKLEELKAIISMAKSTDKKVVFTNGCFDILHRGHVEVLAKTADLGDKLISGLNSNSSIK